MKHSTLSSARRSRGLLLAAAAVLCIAAAPARAAILNQSVGFDLISETGGTSPRLDFSAALPLFDPVLGTLNQVDISYDFDLSLEFSVSNRSLSAETFTLGPTSLVVEGERFFDRFDFINSIDAVFVGGTYTVPAGTDRTFGDITIRLPGRLSDEFVLDSRFTRTSTPLIVGNTVVRPQGDVSPFVGVDDMTLMFAALTRSALDLPTIGSVLDGVRSFTSWDLAGSVDVTYDYTPAVSPIPVPAALPLFLSALAGLGFVARRRKRQTA